jgi:hypothetical protein
LQNDFERPSAILIQDQATTRNVDSKIVRADSIIASQLFLVEFCNRIICGGPVDPPSRLP